MVLQIILADILLVARIFPRPCGARKNTTQLVKYPRVLSVKPSNKVYLFHFTLKFMIQTKLESIRQIKTYSKSPLVRTYIFFNSGKIDSCILG